MDLEGAGRDPAAFAAGVGVSLVDRSDVAELADVGRKLRVSMGGASGALEVAVRFVRELS